MTQAHTHTQRYMNNAWSEIVISIPILALYWIFPHRFIQCMRDISTPLPQTLYILHVKNVRQTPHFVDVAKGPPYLAKSFITPMCASWLSSRLNAMMDIVFLTCLWYSFFIFGLALEGRVASNPSTISQWSTEANPIFNWTSKDWSLFVEFVNDSSTLTLILCHATLKDWVYSFHRLK